MKEKKRETRSEMRIDRKVQERKIGAKEKQTSRGM